MILGSQRTGAFGGFGSEAESSGGFAGFFFAVAVSASLSGGVGILTVAISISFIAGCGAGVDLGRRSWLIGSLFIFRRRCRSR